MSKESISDARERFRRENIAAVEKTRAEIERVRKNARTAYFVNLERRKATFALVAQNLDKTVKAIRREHEQVRNKLGQETVSREVHVRVNRSLEALETFVRVQREANITGERIASAIEDPAIVGSAADRQRRAAVVDLLQSAQKQLLQQTEFINIAAHELRTPIMPILINADLLEEDLGTKNEELESIKRNALRLHRLAENILNVARIGSDSLLLRKETFDLNSLIVQLIKDRKPPSKKVRLELRLSEGELVVDADKGRIEQVVSNLLDNAFKFTPEGEVSLSTASEGGKAFVTVEDNGKGIGSDIFPVLFTKFSARSEGGTGLGLFICKGIIDAHGGSITAADNAKGRGATFEFTLPLRPPGPELPQSEQGPG